MLHALRNAQATVWTAMPGIIKSYNAAETTAEVQVAIKAQVTSKEGDVTWETLPMLVDCPVLFPGGGGFTLTFPIKADDECLVIFSSRCIDAWWQSSGVQQQSELRMHDLSDGFVLVGPRSKPRVLSPNPRTNAVELRSDDATAWISIEANKNINVNTTGTVAIVAPTITLTGDVTITGDIHNNGKLVGSGIKVTGVVPGSGQSTGVV